MVSDVTLFPMNVAMQTLVASESSSFIADQVTLSRARGLSSLSNCFEAWTNTPWSLVIRRGSVTYSYRGRHEARLEGEYAIASHLKGREVVLNRSGLCSEVYTSVSICERTRINRFCRAMPGMACRRSLHRRPYRHISCVGFGCLLPYSLRHRFNDILTAFFLVLIS